MYAFMKVRKADKASNDYFWWPSYIYTYSSIYEVYTVYTKYDIAMGVKLMFTKNHLKCALNLKTFLLAVKGFTYY